MPGLTPEQTAYVDRLMARYEKLGEIGWRVSHDIHDAAGADWDLLGKKPVGHGGCTPRRVVQSVRELDDLARAWNAQAKRLELHMKRMARHHTLLMLLVKDAEAILQDCLAPEDMAS